MLICVHPWIIFSSSAQAPPPRPGQPAAGAQVAQNPLKPFEWLTGGTWSTKGEYPGLGKAHGNRAYRYTLGGKFIEMQQEVLVGPGEPGEMRTAAIALIGRNPATRRLRQWGFTHDGSVVIFDWDVVSPVALRFEGRVINREPGRLRGIVSRNWRIFAPAGQEAFEETVDVFRDGGWRPYSRSRFARLGEPLAPGEEDATGPAEPLRLLAPLAGTWTQQAEPGGAQLDARLTFRWVLNYSFLRGESVVYGGGEPAKRQAISFTGYDAQQGRVAQYGFSEDGSVFTASGTAAGDALVLEGEMVGESRRKLRVTYRRSDADTLVILTEVFRSGAWEKLGESVMKKK